MDGLFPRIRHWLKAAWDWIRCVDESKPRCRPREDYASSAAVFLCDACKYNYGNVCSRSERPNATRCPDFKRH